ncbi:hypothetical protein [Pedobacter caeni]|uniref:Uncharacterized protein n=1 Tax=Pedobacter caeni TaxID=288992 RepID=A0A1M4U801_9SPHI|nr:hypothetical protein [Pedobacter caeni]SHE52845.1 hypothetical protein SAMN04488522_101462 [Pedobacter caeni]
MPKIKDKVEALRLYIENNLSDNEGDSWPYVHNRQIVYHIDRLSKVNCEQLVLKIWDWDAEIIMCLADPFLEISNPNLDGCFLYCKLFLAAEKFEDVHYLGDNLPYAISHINTGTQPLGFYVDLETKVMETFKDYDPLFISYIRAKLEKEKMLRQEKS